MTKKQFFVLIAFTGILFLANIAVADKTTQQLVKEARSEVASVSIQDAGKMLDKDDDVIFLDVRGKDEFEKSHVPGAINISRGLLEFMVENKIPDKNAKIVVY